MGKTTNNDVIEAYQEISNSKTRHGVFFKTLFHVHTPESYDYTLLNKWNMNEYKKKSDNEIYNECQARQVFPNVFSDASKIEFDSHIFCTRKEFLSFLLLAHELINNGIEMVIVADHNTLSGIVKIKSAIAQLKMMKSSGVYTEVISGIELSCADKLHIVALIDDNDRSTVLKFEKWLCDNLLDVKDGLLKTSFDAMTELNELGIFSYIAHINTSDIFKEGRFLSGAYRKTLFNSKFTNIIGVSNEEKKEFVLNKLKEYKTDPINIIIDNDAHNIDDIADKFFWIKGSKRNYKMLLDAISDYEVSITFSTQNTTNQYIKGIHISNQNCVGLSKNSFLSGEKSVDPFTIKLSNSLNCFIGGRGTGKSTVLEMVEYCLSQRCKSHEMLEFLCNHGDTFVLYEFLGNEYIIKMSMPFKTNLEKNILRYFGQNERDDYNFRYKFNETKVNSFAKKNYLSVFEIIKNSNDTINAKKVSDKSTLLNKFYNTKYSVNELVQTAGSDQINNFIYNLAMSNKNLKSSSTLIKSKTKSGLVRELKSLKLDLVKREKKVNGLLNDFNNTQINRLKIVYSQDHQISEPAIEAWILFNQNLKDLCFGYNITKDNIVQYLLSIYDKVEWIDFYLMIIERRVNEAEFPILNFSVESQLNSSTDNLIEICQDNQKEVIDLILSEINREISINKIRKHIADYLDKMEKYTLEFNINNKVTSRSSNPNFQKVSKLSLGQKVVAMLDFILAYSEYSKDYSPLIIDQPEDNLDNQYIFNNLVQQLRNVKTQRQVIIATHNSTIVTNAMTDLVVVMESDGTRGWIKVSGYPGESRIKHQIVNNLEGGIDSFIHKQRIYAPVLKK